MGNPVCSDIGFLHKGNLVKNHVYEEQDNYEEADLHQLAFFKTRIGVRNALPSEMIDVAASLGASASAGSQEDDAEKEAVLISLARPVIMVQSVAFDKVGRLFLRCWLMGFFSGGGLSNF